MTEIVDPREDERKLRILTYNVGLLRVKLFGALEVWGNPPYSKERLPLIPARLKSVNADIITLQGAYCFLYGFHALKRLLTIFLNDVTISSQSVTRRDMPIFLSMK